MLRETKRKTDHRSVLIVPDVHLRIRTLEKLLDSWAGPVIFLGDFFDDFGDNPVMNLEMANFVKQRLLVNSDYTILMGNHDLHYAPQCPSPLRCSGWEAAKQEAIQSVLGESDFAKFQWSAVQSGFLITHAGLHPRLIMDSRKRIGVEKLSEWINQSCWGALSSGDYTEPLLNAGLCRYGPQPVGGVVWMDVREYEPVASVPQIFGHTVLREPALLTTNGSTSYCIDTNLLHSATLHPNGTVELHRVSDLVERKGRGG